MSKSYTVMELEAIKKLCKCVKSVASLPTDLIADTNVATNTTYSSYKIDAKMSALENDVQAYVDYALAGLNKLTKEVIDDKTLVVKENVLYLYKDPTDMNNDYMQMMLINGTVVELGNTTCDMSGYYTNTEVDDKFALKIDLDVLATSFNNLVTSVKNKVDKDSIITVLDDTVTDEQVPSARIVVDELGLKANDSEVVKKTDIATTIDLSSTDEQVASAKAVYDGLENINDFSVQVVKESLDLNDITETGIYYFSQTYTPVNIPVGVNGWLLVMKGSSSDIVKQVWYRLGTANSNSYNTFERYKGNNTWSEWTKFLTEKEYYNALDYGNPIIPQDADLNDYLTPGVYTCMSSTIANTLANCPHISSNFKLIVNKNRGNADTLFYGYQMIVGTKGGNPVTDVCVYYRGISVYDNVCVFSKWKIMSGSTVADVPLTKLTVNSWTSASIYYTVKNGICFVIVDSLMSATMSTPNQIIVSGLPKPMYNNVWHSIAANEGAYGSLLVRVTGENLINHIGSDNAVYFGTFSYPVAE